jgi:hypothetical protein
MLAEAQQSRATIGGDLPTPIATARPARAGFARASTRQRLPGTGHCRSSSEAPARQSAAVFARMPDMQHRSGREGLMRIELHKEHGTRYRSTLHRADGVVVALEGGSWNRIGGPVGRVPHDLAHLVIEQQLGLPRGLWGVLAAGGLVQNAAFVRRRPPHGHLRAKRVTDAAAEELRRPRCSSAPSPMPP